MRVLLNRWVLLALVVLSLAAALFSRDAFEQTIDASHGLFGSAQEYSAGAVADSPDVSSARIRSGLIRNDPAQVAVTEIQFESRTVDHAVLSARLASSVAGNDYPHLRVELKSADGRLIRSVELRPAQYEHAAALTDEHIRFSVDVRPGEARVAAHPSYPLAAPSGAPTAPA